MQLYQTKKAGYTLIELVVVLVVVGILAALSVPAFTRTTEKAKTAEVALVFARFEQMQSVFYQEMGRVGSLQEIGFQIPDSKYFSYRGSSLEFGTGGSAGAAAGFGTTTNSDSTDGTSSVEFAPTLKAFALTQISEKCPAGAGLFSTWTPLGILRGDIGEGACSRTIPDFFD